MAQTVVANINYKLLPINLGAWLPTCNYTHFIFLCAHARGVVIVEPGGAAGVGGEH